CVRHAAFYDRGFDVW
nr:immunoglobulin heavy chain junction region [Macaca mulatta]MOV49169.1 immunoglobulin heavy chain junction region [Macaca mulatta]MOV49450.1 immunoglobulin heavy chain junction region [Macaca mulatta]MOV49454.1 immunoglobulin heavy chain junction region [Macaca mulatta]MOV49786.1 immunoglobulin heavy chain junction region [Macaca mulatta]